MKNGTQLSPAESAAMCGTDWPVFCAWTGFGPLSELFPAAAGLASLLSFWEPPFESAWADPPVLPPELDSAEAPVGSELVVGVVDDELGATGIVVSWTVDPALPLGLLDVLGVPLPFPLPAPGMADPYWSWEGEVAAAVGASGAATSAITASAVASRGTQNPLNCAPCIEGASFNRVPAFATAPIIVRREAACRCSSLHRPCMLG